MESASLEVFLSSFAKQKHRKSIGGGKPLDDLLVSEHQSGFIYRNSSKGIQNAMLSFVVASLEGNMVATFIEIYILPSGRVNSTTALFSFYIRLFHLLVILQ